MAVSITVEAANVRFGNTGQKDAHKALSQAFKKQAIPAPAAAVDDLSKSGSLKDMLATLGYSVKEASGGDVLQVTGFVHDSFMQNNDEALWSILAPHVLSPGFIAFQVDFNTHGLLYFVDGCMKLAMESGLRFYPHPYRMLGWSYMLPDEWRGDSSFTKDPGAPEIQVMGGELEDMGAYLSLFPRELPAPISGAEVAAAGRAQFGKELVFRKVPGRGFEACSAVGQRGESFYRYWVFVEGTRYCAVRYSYSQHHQRHARLPRLHAVVEQVVDSISPLADTPPPAL